MNCCDGVFDLLGDVVPSSQFMCDLPGGAPIVINLEAPITSVLDPAPGKIVLRASQEWLVAGFGGRLRVAGLANNHIMDHGLGGLSDTIQFLDSAGVAWFGVGRDAQSVKNAVVVELSGVRVGFCGYVCPTTHPVFATKASPGVAPPELAAIQNDVQLARQRGAQRVVVAMHWGVEEVPYPRPEDIDLARAIASLGVDLLIGHHSHCVQPFEVIKNTHVFYGLGNAIMPDICEPCNYDAHGVAHGQFKKKQRPWNRRSLSVRYSAREGTVEVKDLRWDAPILKETGSRLARRAAMRKGPRGYEAALFRFASLCGVSRNLVAGFMERPRIPNLVHLRALLGKS
jgi:hypothetical protein